MSSRSTFGDVRLWAPVLGLACLAPGCGCKRPSIVADPLIVSYTFRPAPPDRLVRGPVSGETQELARVQAALARSPRDPQALAFFDAQVCAALGQAPGCVRTVREVGAVRRSADDATLVRPARPRQYLVCLERSVRFERGLLERALAPAAVERAGGELRPNVLWRLRQDPPPPPSADEGLAARHASEQWDWPLRQIDYASALEKLRAKRPGEAPGAGVRVAQLDTGYTESCQLRADPSVAGVSVASALGYDYFGCQDDPADPLAEALLPLEARQPSHGTATASVLGSPHVPPKCEPPAPAEATGAARDQVIGVAPAATLIPVRVTDGIILGMPAVSKPLLTLQGVSFDLRVQSLIAGIFHAMQAGASVISISMGGVCADDAQQSRNNAELRGYLAEAEAAGIVVVAAAGQYPIPGFLRRLFFEDYPVTFPGSFPSVVAVAASSVFAEPWSQSSRGAKVDVAAPGFGVWRAQSRLDQGQRVDELATGNGTSFSTAVAAGAATLWVQYWGKGFLSERFGPATSAAFRYALRRSAAQPAELARRLAGEPYGPELARRARAWNTGEFGAGILDLARLLDVDMASVTRTEVCRLERERLPGAEDGTDEWSQRFRTICGGA